MSFDICVPASGGEYMDAVVVVQWCAEPGQAVKAGQTLVVVETAKTSIDIEAPADGIMGEILAREGAEVAIGGLLGRLSAQGVQAATVAPNSDRQAVSPAARKLARERGIDLSTVNASSPTGRIKLRDLPLADSLAVPRENSLYLQRRGGSQGAPIVFIHGFGGDTVSWTPLLSCWNAERPAVLLDLPSHGRSARSDVQGFQWLADSVLSTLQASGLSDVHLVGHSLGGAVAIALAASGRIGVRSLALLAPAGLGPEVNGDFIRGFARANEVGSLTPWLRKLVADKTLIDAAMAALAMEARDDPALRQAQQNMAATLFTDDTQRVDLRRELMGLGMPRKIIWGLQDEIIPWRQALGLDGGAGLHLLPGVGHMPQFEAAQSVADLIDELIRSAS